MFNASKGALLLCMFTGLSLKSRNKKWTGAEQNAETTENDKVFL